MDDTDPKIKALIHKRMMALSPSQRVEMASQMFDAAREIILSSIPAHLPKGERLRRLAERLYGPELAKGWWRAWKKKHGNKLKHSKRS